MARKNDAVTYPVVVTEDVFAEGNGAFADTLSRITGESRRKLMIVADSNVVQRTEGLGSKIGRYLRANGLELAGTPVVVGGGEKAKNDSGSSIGKVINQLISSKLGCEDVVIAIGGGAVLDVAGYAAAQVRGGIKLIRMPTTVAAMVDGAFADHAAMDIAGIKDSAMLASVPSAVIVDTLFAKTILDGVWRGGLGEVVRLAAATDAKFMKLVAEKAEALHRRDYDTFVEVVRECVKIRQKTNGGSFGVWGALRLEAMSSYKLPHGYAVAIAMAVDMAYAVEKGAMKQKDRDLVYNALVKCGALDGLVYSKHLFNQIDSYMRGLDAWRLVCGTERIQYPAALGKLVAEDSPDHSIYEKVLREFASSAQPS